MKVDPQKIARVSGATLDVPVGANGILEPQGVGERFKTNFVGWEEGKYVLLKLPSKLDLRDNLYTGKLVIVRYMNCGGQICGFESAIQTSIVVPYRLLFLDFPITIELLSLRKQDRVDCFLPATLRRGEDLIAGKLMNISRGGCHFVVEAQVLKGHPLLAPEVAGQCEFKIIGTDEQAYDVACVVKKSYEDKGITHLGLQFVDAPEEMQRSIDEYVQDAAKFLGSSCRVMDTK